MAKRSNLKLLVGCALCVASVVLTALIFEASFRAIAHLTGKQSIYQFDAELGWAPIPNFRLVLTRQAQDGRPYDVRYSTNRYGFRYWGNPVAERPRIFFVGDSFTQDENMSNESAYFAQVARSLSAEVFAVGGGGYGTLQEMIMLKRSWGKINPTHVVVQFCPNDLLNNHFDSESLSIVRLQKNFRPYLIDGQVVYRKAAYYRFLARHSMLFRFLDHRIQNLQHSWFNGYFNPEHSATMETMREDAVEVTVQVLRMMRGLGSKDVQWYMFSCAPASVEWSELARRAGFQPIPHVAEAVTEAEEQGVAVRSIDGSHWNDRGHAIAGRVLSKFLENEIPAGQRGAEVADNLLVD